MIIHIVMWNINPETDPTEADNQIGAFKLAAESLVDEIDGIVNIEVHRRPLPSSSRDLMLVSVHTDADALQLYMTHPSHVAAAKLISDVVTDRVCFDYEKSFD